MAKFVTFLLPVPSAESGGTSGAWADVSRLDDITAAIVVESAGDSVPSATVRLDVSMRTLGAGGTAITAPAKWRVGSLAVTTTAEMSNLIISTTVGDGRTDIVRYRYMKCVYVTLSQGTPRIQISGMDRSAADE